MDKPIIGHTIIRMLLHGSLPLADFPSLVCLTMVILPANSQQKVDSCPWHDRAEHYLLRLSDSSELIFSNNSIDHRNDELMGHSVGWSVHEFTNVCHHYCMLHQ